MRIQFIEVANFRKLKAAHIDFGNETTIFVGANNSGKTSAMVALRSFLLSPNRLLLRDVTISNWTAIDRLGDEWESGDAQTIDLNSLLPLLDVWLNVPLSEIHHVVHILPTLDWSGGLLGVRLQFKIEDIDKLKNEYLLQRVPARDAAGSGKDGTSRSLRVWPESLTDFLDKRLNAHVKLVPFALDPSALSAPVQGYASPQQLPVDAIPLDGAPFRQLIKVDEIAAQRDFADAGENGGRSVDGPDAGQRRFKRRLSDQLRTYYDRHLDPFKTPSEKDFEALGAIQAAERSFDQRLEDCFAAALSELEDLGYPGMANPKLKISTLLRATDGLRHGSAVQYQVADPTGDGSKTLKLPEDYSGLGYQNLIAMVFMLMGYRDEWMRVGKSAADIESESLTQIEPLHLLLVEEPEAHLHAQVQQVFINKAYSLLRKHPDLGAKTTYSSQLVVSTHSSHIAHEADFANLRYFRRRPASNKGETPTTTVANLSYIFGEGNDTHRFVKRYLKATHCELFFADGIIFVEGQAERLLVPHFIRHQFPELSKRYVTILELGGSHAHRFETLVQELGLATLVIADLDATSATQIKTRNGNTATRWKSARPRLGMGQKTANQVLKSWHPQRELIDELVALTTAEQQVISKNEYQLYVAYQKAIPSSSGAEVIPRTFEDALVHTNVEVMQSIDGSKTSDKIREIVSQNLINDELEDELHELLKNAEKAAFALDCLMLENPKSLKPPDYIADGLKWFEAAVGREVSASETVVVDE